jgi:LEA14-like dessication related protein
MRIAVVFAVLASFVAVAACPGAQVKPVSIGPDAGVVLRRIDVVDGGFDELKVNVVIAVTNPSSSDLDVAAELDIALVGEGSAEGDGTGGGAEGDASDGADDGATDTADASGDNGAAPAAAEGLDGSRHAGKASGVARAENTSELLVPVTLPLPSDPAVLDTVLGWKRGRVHVKGRVRTGFTEQTIAGERDVATPSMPQLKMKNAQVAKVDGGATGEAFFVLLLDNRNTFDVTVDKIAWDIAIAGKSLRSKEDGSTSLPPSAVEEYNESIELDEKSFPAKELKALLRQPAIPYVVRGSIEVRGVRRDFHFNGEMQFPR